MFFKQICIGILLLAVWGFFYGDYIFYKQAEFMLWQDYKMPAYEAYERIVKYYPKSKYVKFARQKMAEIRKSSDFVSTELEKKENEYRKIQLEREKKESFH